MLRNLGSYRRHIEEVSNWLETGKDRVEYGPAAEDDNDDVDEDEDDINQDDVVVDDDSDEEDDDDYDYNCDYDVLR